MAKLKGIVVLIVEDDDILREFLAQSCLDEGASVLRANCGDEAFKIVKENRIDVVVSDIRMPRGDGVSLLKNIRSHQPPQPVVILVTGYSDVSTVAALELGAAALIPKPFSRNQLFDLINERVPRL
jgi:DNA-binding NtrC family response regulator